jgi:hypothetical protein
VLQNAELDQPHEIANGGAMGRASELLEIGVGDPAVVLDMGDGQALTLVQGEPIDDASVTNPARRW